jgi:hypothetical protein
MRHVTDLIQDKVLNGNDATKVNIMSKFGVTNFKIETGDFFSFLADIFSGGVQTGRRTEMCDYLTSNEFKLNPIDSLVKLAKTYN